MSRRNALVGLLSPSVEKFARSGSRVSVEGCARVSLGSSLLRYDYSFNFKSLRPSDEFQCVVVRDSYLNLRTDGLRVQSGELGYDTTFTPTDSSLYP